MPKLRVLMVDDDEADVFIVRRHLRQVGSAEFTLDKASSASEGLTGLLRGDHDAYLVDWNLGADDGVELVAEAVAKGCDAAIVMLTGHSSRELELRALEAGAEVFLEKGRMDPTLLERSIRMAIERHSMRRTLAARNLELERTKEALACSKTTLEQFTFVISHDLREPLQMISGLASEIEKRCAEVLDEESARFMGLRFVHEGLSHMHTLIDGLLGT